MKKFMWTISAFVFISGCGEKNAEAPSTSTEENQDLIQISEQHNSTNTTKEFQKSPEINKAKNLVREYLELQDSSNPLVEFDHRQKDGFVIHVYDVIDRGKKSEHIVTRGWYLVTLEPEHIKVIK